MVINDNDAYTDEEKKRIVTTIVNANPDVHLGLRLERVIATSDLPLDNRISTLVALIAGIASLISTNNCELHAILRVTYPKLLETYMDREHTRVAHPTISDN